MSVSHTGNELWQYEFENEEVNDDRWSCLVSAFVESELDDEEYFQTLYQYLTSGKISLVRTISMTDVIELFKIEKETKKEELKVKGKTKIDKSDHSSILIQPPPPRFPEVIPFLSKFAIISDGLCKLTPKLMAYALKYMILCLKDQNYYERRITRMINRKIKEAEVKAKLLKTLNGESYEKINETDKSWKREKFDIFGEPFKDGPFQSPELYIVLYEFYDPFIFQELLKLKVPFRAVTKIENFRFISGRPSRVGISKKSEIIKNFWKSIEGSVSDEIALLKYATRVPDEENYMDMSSVTITDLTALLYSIFHVYRLHQTYIQQMQVHRMIESLELLDLSKCIIYNELCDALIIEDSNAEIFVLYSMIEQVVAGVPETENKILNYEKKPSSFFEWEEDVIEKKISISREINELEKSSKNRDNIQRNGGIFFHDDKISLTTMAINSNILKSNEIFDRFIINSISSKIRNKFMRLSPTLKAQNDFTFYQLWQIGKENIDFFRVKVYFLFTMKLIERIKIFDFGFVSESSQDESIQSNIHKSKSDSELLLPEEESYDSCLSDVQNLFYKPQLNVLAKNLTMKFSSFATKVRKVQANAILEEGSSISSEDLNIVCGKCPKIKYHENLKDKQIQYKKLNEFLESCEISHLNEPNFLPNPNKYESFAEKHGFYETFEPNRTAQKLQEIFDGHNTIEYTYFSPTDTLFVLGHNDSDFRGVYRSFENGFITSPLCLRDFVRYVLPENKKWITTVNEKYIKFLKEIWMRRLDEEKKRDHEIRCGLMKMYKGMSESERELFLNETITDQINGKDKKESNKIERESGIIDLEDLPKKERQRRPDKEFFGINFGETRTQVNVVNYEYHSDDGSMIGVKTRSWLNSESTVTLTAERHGCQLFVHRWIEDMEKRIMFFREPSGITITFDINSHPFPVKIRQPNGLLIEINKTASHIKQIYSESYKWGEEIEKEKFRCCLRDGSVLKFCIDDTVEVLCPSGTKHICHKLSSGGEDVEIYETLTPTGELWVRDDCSKCKRLGKSMLVLLGVDAETRETFYKREDGTSCMLWPDGKLVTIYPDGTKITTMPKFKEQNLILETEEDKLTDNEQEKNFDVNENPMIDNLFTIVTCSYLIEHPKYATVNIVPPKLELRVLGKLKVDFHSKKSLKIECYRSILKVSTENAEFFSTCRHCGKKSISKIFLGSEELLSKSKDYDGYCFYVYSSGQILHESCTNKKINNYQIGHGDKCEGNTQNDCWAHKSCRPRRRCLIIERDLNGLEFLNEYALQRYHGSLSRDAYYDLGKVSHDKTHLQHAFYDPIYRIGREKYLMKYEKDDGYPTRLTRKNMKGNNPVNCIGDLVKREKRKEIPKAMIVRFIRVFLPDPTTVTKEIMRDIAIYQKRSLDLTENYGKSIKVKQRPFARYIAEELELIASQLCPSLQLYHHTCRSLPYTEMDIHSMAHRNDRSNYFVESNPVDCQTKIFPQCKRIPKPLIHSGHDEDISEMSDDDDDDDNNNNNGYDEK